MINIIRPVMETNKTVTQTTEKSFNNNTKDKQENQQKIEITKNQKKQSDYKQEELEKAVAKTNRVLFQDNDHFEFKIHERTGRMMVKLVDNETDEVIKEIPPEKILDLVASIWDLVGILVDERG